jgi:AbrB family looped-hinge helix DNA binding protein
MARLVKQGPVGSLATGMARTHDRGSVNGMRTTIDKAGRLVIPRVLRDRIGLAGGGEVDLELDGAAVRIEPVSGGGLREDGGLLIIPAAGTSITAAAVRELIDADRHAR